MNSKRFLVTSAAVIVVGGLVLSSCSGSSTTAVGGSSTSTSAAAAPSNASAASSPSTSGAPASSPPASTAPSAVSSAPASSGTAAGTDLKTATTKLGTVIVDAKGMTVYYFKPDVPNSGKSACSGGCLKAWPAVGAAAATATATGVTGKLGEITRDDGTKQVTVDGRPVYLFAKDKAPGDVAGQGVGGVWFVVSPSGAQIGS